MHTEKREDPLVELGYEIRDLNTKAIRNAAIGFFIFAFGSGIVGFVIFRLMNPAGFVAEKAQHRLMPQEPNPMVQTNLTAKEDIMDIRQHERAVLEAPVGWTDDTHTKLHLPIEKAMEIVAARGLPESKTNVPATSPGQTLGTPQTPVAKTMPASPGTGQLPPPAASPSTPGKPTRKLPSPAGGPSATGQG